MNTRLSTSKPFWLLSAGRRKIFIAGKPPKHQYTLAWFSVADGDLTWGRTSDLIAPQPDRSWPIQRWSSALLLELLESKTRETSPETRAGTARFCWKELDLSWFLPILRKSSLGESVTWEEANQCYQTSHPGMDLPQFDLLSPAILENFRELERISNWIPPWEQQDGSMASAASLFRPPRSEALPPPPLPNHYDPEKYWLVSSLREEIGRTGTLLYSLITCSIPDGEIHLIDRTVPCNREGGLPGKRWMFSELRELLATAHFPSLGNLASTARTIWEQHRLEWFRPILEDLAAGKVVTYSEANEFHQAAHAGKSLRLYPFLAPSRIRAEWEKEMRYDY